MLHIRMKPTIAISGSFNHHYSYNFLSKCLKEEIKKCGEGIVPFHWQWSFNHIYRYFIHVCIVKKKESIVFYKNQSIIKVFRVQRKTFSGLQSLLGYSVSNGRPFCFRSVSFFSFSKTRLYRFVWFLFLYFLFCFPYIF